MDFKKGACVKLKDDYSGKTDKCLGAPAKHLVGIIDSISGDNVTVKFEESRSDYIKNQLDIVDCPNEAVIAAHLIVKLNERSQKLGKYLKNIREGITDKLSILRTNSLTIIQENTETDKYGNKKKSDEEAAIARKNIEACDGINPTIIGLVGLPRREAARSVPGREGTLIYLDLEKANSTMLTYNGSGVFKQETKEKYKKHISKLREHIDKLEEAIPEILKKAKTHPVLNALLAGFNLTKGLAGGRKSRKQRNTRRRRTFKISRSR